MTPPIRRRWVTEADIQIVHQAIKKIGNASMVQIRRELPTMNSRVIANAIIELRESGLVDKDESDWPPKYRDSGVRV